MTERQDNSASRIILGLAGAVGALGVMAAARAGHGEDERLFESVAIICLAHGPALLAVALSGNTSRLVAVAGVILAAGTLLFTGDLLARQFLGYAAAPLLAPAGGAAMIAGWALFIAAALWRHPPLQ